MGTTHDLDGLGFTVTTFSGGARGPCLQLDGDGSLVLTRERAAKLFHWLHDYLDAVVRDEEEAAKDVGVQDQPRDRLIARMAGNIAVGVLREISPKATEAVAEYSVEIARAILQRIEEGK